MSKEKKQRPEFTPEEMNDAVEELGRRVFRKDNPYVENAAFTQEEEAVLRFAINYLGIKKKSPERKAISDHTQWLGTFAQLKVYQWGIHQDEFHGSEVSLNGNGSKAPLRGSEADQSEVRMCETQLAIIEERIHRRRLTSRRYLETCWEIEEFQQDPRGIEIIEPDPNTRWKILSERANQFHDAHSIIRASRRQLKEIVFKRPQQPN